MISEKEILYHAILFGAYITFVYDWLRILRRVMPHHSFVVGIEDFGFWVYCTVKLLYLLHRESNGNLRWFAVMGAMGSMLLYKKLFSEFIVKYVSLVLCKFLEVLCKPIKWALTELLKKHKMKRERRISERKSHGKTKSGISQETSESV